MLAPVTANRASRASNAPRLLSPVSIRVTGGWPVVMIKIRPSPAAIHCQFGAQNAAPSR
jgi:hypothetical protein